MRHLGLLRQHPVLSAVGLLALVVVALGLLALPFRGVQSSAQSAQGELTKAVEAIKAGDTDTGFVHVGRARTHVDDVTDVTHGPSGAVWSVMPIVGSSIRDVRDLAAALDELTTAAEVVADLEPQVSGPGSSLTEDGNVNLDTLDRLLDGIREIDGHVTEARAHLESVNDYDRFMKARMASSRDEAMRQVLQVEDGLDQVEPLLDVLPRFLGAEGRQTYLVAMLNPAEMKYSGGSMLTFSQIRTEEGEISRRRIRDVGSNSQFFRAQRWPAVKGNPFHPDTALLTTKANLAPSWPVAGEETLRAWQARTSRENDGLIALDVVAVSRLLEVTGPLEVPGVGEVSMQELVEVTVGSYDTYDQDHPRRRAINRALIPAFMDRMFGGVDFIGTMRALVDIAHSRHMSLYFRDADLQDVTEKVGFAGDLGPAEHDYLGIFSQNQVGSKADYHQRKTITHDVKLRQDGSARVTTTARMDNNGPLGLAGMQLGPYVDPTLDTTLASFLPEQAEVVSAQLQHSTTGTQALPTTTQDYYGRPFLEPRTVIEPGESATLTVVYDVPEAAIRGSRTLDYRLSVDNHPTVQPETLTVTVKWPDGFNVNELPEGWTWLRPGVTQWHADILEGQQRFSVVAER